MAKKQLTIEEKLEAALVPVEEQPYKVPENWCWVRLDNINEHKSTTVDPQNYPNDDFELYSVPSSTDDYPEMITGEEIGSTKQVVQKDDVLLCKINPRINRVWKVSQYTDNRLLASSEWIIVRNKNILSDYLMWCFRTPYFRKYMLSNVSGVGGSLMRAQPKYVKTYPIPLPPYIEQSRIVARIESLFAKLDEAKEKVQEILDGADLRRAAILHQAFTGKLTAKWRKERGVRLEDWRKTTLKEISSAIGDGLHGTPEYDAEGKYFFINGNNFFDDHIEIKPDTKKVNEKEYNKYKIALSSSNTVFLSINGTLGKTAFYNNEPVILGKSACYINVMSMVNKYWLKYFFQTLEFINYANEKATGSTIKNLGLKAIREKKIYLPSMPEQQEIVRLLDNLLSREQSTVTACEEALTTIDTLKKSILARAFRGELGTNDPTESSAKELLQEILAS